MLTRFHSINTYICPNQSSLGIIASYKCEHLQHPYIQQVRMTSSSYSNFNIPSHMLVSLTRKWYNSTAFFYPNTNVNPAATTSPCF